MLSTSRWLGSLPADSQVVELVVKASTTTGTLMVGAKPGAEVNYARGGRRGGRGQGVGGQRSRRREAGSPHRNLGHREAGPVPGRPRADVRRLSHPHRYRRSAEPGLVLGWQSVVRLHGYRRDHSAACCATATVWSFPTPEITECERWIWLETERSRSSQVMEASGRGSARVPLLSSSCPQASRPTLMATPSPMQATIASS